MALKHVRERHDDALARIDWRTMETLLAGHFRDAGYAVEHVGTAGSGARYDGGIDLKLRRADEFIVVQVKHWNVFQVPHNEVHQLLGVMVNEGATGAILVCSGEFTRAAREAAARQGHVQLIDGRELRALLAARMAALPPTDSAAGLTFRHPPQARRNARTAHRRGALLVWVGVALVGALATALLLRALLQRTAWSAGRSDAGVASAPASEPVVAAPDADAPEPRGNAAAPELPNCAVTADGAVVDCVEAPTSKPLTPAELREQQRRADEAMKVLEATTPEM